MIDILFVGADLSRTAQTHVGEPVCVVLEDIATTGYRWTPVVDPAAATVTDRGVAPGDAPGAAGQRRFEVAPHRKGRIVVRFALRRPWEADARPEREAVLTLDVD